MESRGEILIVDDLEPNRDILARILMREQYAVRQAESGEIALAEIEKAHPDLVLLDVSMPGLNGFEVCEQIKSDPVSAHIPVIFVSALGELGNKVKAFEVGGVDYIIKPYKVQEVVARVNSQMTMAHQRKEILQLNTLKDQILRTVSHDLKNPLHIVMGYAAMMMEGDGIDHNGMIEMSGQIFESADRMLQLVTNLLDITKIEEGLQLNLANMPLRKLAENILKNYQLPAEQKNIALYLDLPDDEIMLKVDSLRIEQVFNNLVSNAIKYTPDEGEVTFAARINEDTVTIAVRDTGLGIPEEALPRLFSKFFRVDTEAHKAQEGTGLGLTIVQAIVEQHGGEIWVESQLGQGSIFYVLLPLPNGEPA